MQEKINPIPQAEIKKNRFSVIWIIPLIALITGVWMVYQHYSKMGIKITLAFENGEGITAGKTLIKYSGVQVGAVDKVKLDPYTKKVIVTATIEKDSQR